ncbi:ATP-binding protein [Paenibacillus sp. J22TS3]|uniref:ATP-binding protein n=1 Tax=Paenibacillus sp. J22TS3 TaxID=2807192 RepID=UPI001B1A8AF3|nr:ATP-binding protein [Paenibacillus sp. J22TS3]GIP21722.1 hypothetical protein J22TS3_19970 [Paenibacillus sp. J22TS3]
MSAILSYRHWLITLSLPVFLCIALYVHILSFGQPYIGMTVRAEGAEWRVEQVDPAGKAYALKIRQGDRILSVDGKLAQNFFHSGERSLKHAKTIETQHPDGSRSQVQVQITGKDLFAYGFSIVMEGMLLGIGWFSYRKRPESHLIRRFYGLNLLMALIILTLYSTELAVSNAILSISAIWLPYALLSFFILLVFQVTRPWLARAFAALRVLLFVFSAYTLYTVWLDSIPGWIREMVNLVFIGALLFILVLAWLYGRTLEQMEKNQLLILVTGIIFSLLPYLFLYALPDLLWKDYIIAPEYAMVGLVPLSATIMYILVKRRMIDMLLYMPKLVIHSLYLTAAFVLFLLAAKWNRPPSIAGLFVLFAGLTALHQLALTRTRRHAEERGRVLERQKLQLSLQLAEKKNIRDIVRMLVELTHRMLEVSGVCILWQQGEERIVHGTGQYADIQGTQLVHLAADHLDEAQLTQRLDAAHVLPIQGTGEDQPFGYIILGHKINKTLYSSDEKQIIERIHTEAAQLFINARLLAELQQEQQRTLLESKTNERRVQNIDQFNHALLEAQEAERIRTSYFLHDTVLQNLIFLSRDLEELYDQGGGSSSQVSSWLKCVYDTQQQIRMLCDDLYPHVVDKAGLKEAVQWLIRTRKDFSGLDITLQYELEPAGPLPPLIKSNIFRIIRELTNNVVKHAEASSLHLHLWAAERAIHITVKDDGIGFQADSIYSAESREERSGFGLISVDSQVRRLGGSMEIDSAVALGTTIQLRIPLANEGEAWASPQASGTAAATGM